MEFLSDKDLVELTGFSSSNKQAQWLEKYGIRHFIRGIDNKVITSWEFIRQPVVSKQEAVGP